MSEPAVPAAPPMPSPLRLVGTLGLIAMISGFLIVLVVEATREPIARNHRVALERAVFTVLPGAVSRANFLLDDDGLVRLDDEDIAGANLFAGYAADGSLVGVALPASDRGYAGEIRMLYGYDPARESIIGFTVLQSSETPGLGDKIGHDPAFLANFEALSVALNENRTALEHDIVNVKPGTKAHPWEIDGISGATVSSAAVARGLHASATRWLPMLDPHRDELQAGGMEGQGR